MIGTAPADEAIRSAAREVLSREEYARFRWADPAWIDTLRQWLADYLVWTRSLAEASPALFGLLIGGLLLLALLLVAHLVWSLRVAMRGRPEKRVEDPPPRHDFAGEAARLAVQGDTLAACRALQLACIELLVRGGAVELARHDSNSTLRARLRGSALPAALREELIAGIDGLERSWFRDREPSPELYAAWRRIHSGLHEAVA